MLRKKDHKTPASDIRAVFLDFDGTVYSHVSEEIPESTIDAVRKLKEKGIVVFLCSGRALPEMDAFDISELDPDGMILTNGLMAVDRNKEIIYDLPCGGELKERLIRIFNEKKIPIYFSAKDQIFINFTSDIVYLVQGAVSSGIPPVKEYEGETFYMASAFIDNEESYKEMMSLIDIAEITYWHEGAVDIVPKGVSKPLGIDKILAKYSIPLEASLAIGDGENDADMLRHCAIGIAMGNSCKEAKEAADYVTSDIDADGVRLALEHYRII
ncbi:MAG: Cof-type HAD-IIB family hydrolase [Erysipelotrichaceae bacterium]|nr:Cof-type HAD-IIB family hydrolase [Erysipelotrichaceae bacterium]